MPSVFVCFFSALIPPLWHNAVIKPALKRWDNELATPEERELARAQNRAAGWPDRKSVVQGKSVSVRVDLGGRRIINKKKRHNHNTMHPQTQELKHKYTTQ